MGQQLAKSLQPQLQQTINRCDTKLEQLGHGFGPQSTKARALKNAALGLLSYDWTKEHQQQVLERWVGGVLATGCIIFCCKAQVPPALHTQTWMHVLCPHTPLNFAT